MKKILIMLLVSIAAVTVLADNFRSSMRKGPELSRMADNMPDRYVLENQYILLCDYLSGTNTHAVLGIPEIGQYLLDMKETDVAKENVLFQYLVQLQVALQLKVHVEWWYSCRWHSEEWAVAVATANMNALFGITPKAIVLPPGISKSQKPLGLAMHAHLTK